MCRTRESRRSILKLSSKDILIDIIRLTILGFRVILIDNSDESSSNEDCITIRVTFTEKAMVIDVTPFAMFWQRTNTDVRSDMPCVGLLGADARTRATWKDLARFLTVFMSESSRLFWVRSGLAVSASRFGVSRSQLGPCFGSGSDAAFKAGE